MEIVSTSPLRVAAIVWQPRERAWVMTVVCKATYLLKPGLSPLADEQDDVRREDQHLGGDERWSLVSASDLAPFKRGADVILVGSAHAPEGRPCASLRARLAVESIDKSIDVYGDRAFPPNGELWSGGPFVKMPLTWERAAGGPGTANPAGMPANGPRDAQGLLPIPNLVPAGARLGGPGEGIAPAGFGPIAPAWPGRVEKLQRHAAGWDHRAWYTRPLPVGLDWAYFNAAPPDQQTHELPSHARIELENLMPGEPRLSTRLVEITPRAIAERAGSSEEVALRCDTLWIDTDRGVASITWRGWLLLPHPTQPGRVVVSAAVGKPAAEAAGTWTAGDTEATRTISLPAKKPAAAAPLPFRLGESAPALASSRLAPAGEGAPREGAAREVWTLREDHPDDASRTLPPTSASKPAWPFQKGAAAILAATANATSTSTSAATSTSTEPREPEPDAASPRRTAVFEVTSPEAWPFGSPGASPESNVGGSNVGGSNVGGLNVGGSNVGGLNVEEPDAAEEDAPPTPKQPEKWLVAPPPLIGPLAGAPSAPAEPIEPVTQIPPPDLPAPAKAAEPAKSAAEAPAPVELTLEQTAAVAAEIAEKRTPREAILVARGLDDRSWADTERRWADAIEEDTARGSGKLRAASDTAYIAAVEGFRGPITLEEYAEIFVGLERRRADRALDALKIQRPALMRIVRLWTKRIAGDPKLAEAAQRAIRAARAK